MVGAASKSHNRDKFEPLLAQVAPVAYGSALRMTQNADEADDLVQETVLKAYKSFDSFEPGTNFKAWFFRIMINQFRYNYRKSLRSPQTTVLDDAPDIYMFIQSANAGLLEDTEDPAKLVIARMTEEQINAALSALPEEFRIVAALYFMDELAYHEIAEMIGCPVGTVRSRLHRARKLLQKALWVVAQEHGIVDMLKSERQEVMQ